MKLTKVIATVLCLMLFASGAMALTSQMDPFCPLVPEGTTAELTFWVARPSSPNIEDFETSTTTFIMEEKTGVHINWIQVPESERETEFNLSLATGKYPDAYMANLTTDDVLSYAGEVFIPIEKYITPEITPNLCRILDENPSIRAMITAPDGHIYTMFTAGKGPHMIYSNKMFVYKPWLDAFVADGGKVPESTIEFEAMLKYFRDHDMNGNGDMNDEMPLVSSTQAWGGDPLSFLICPFQLTPVEYNLYLADENNHVYSPYITPEFREGLKWMNHLFEEKLLMEETYVQDVSQMKALVNKAEPSERIVGCYLAAWNGVYQDNLIVPNDLYVSIAPLAGPTGLRQVPASAGGLSTFGLRCAVTTACKNPELAVRYMDLGLAPYATGYDFYLDYGQAGINFNWVYEGESLTGELPYRVEVADPPHNTRWLNQLMPIFEELNATYNCPVEGSINAYLVPPHEQYAPFYVNNNLPMVTWNTDADAAIESSDLGTSIKEITKSFVARFVTGIIDINDDSEWNAYLNELKKADLDRYLELRQITIFGK